MNLGLPVSFHPIITRPSFSELRNFLVKSIKNFGFEYVVGDFQFFISSKKFTTSFSEPL
jgi:hypothetical protein